MSQDNNLPCASSEPTALPRIPVTSLAELDPLPLFNFVSKEFPAELKPVLDDPDNVYNDHLAFERLMSYNDDNKWNLLSNKDWEKEKKYFEDQQNKAYVQSILDQIDKKYSSGFKDNTFAIHAQLSYSKYWNAGLNIIEFFTNDNIDTVWLGNSSSDMRSHYIIKDRSRNMVFEFHNAYGQMDIFPLTGIMGYLEAYNDKYLHSEEWINLNLGLPAYDMIPIEKLDKDDSSSQLQNDSEEVKNLCTICKVDMGPNNPRQLCRKTYCENEDVV